VLAYGDVPSLQATRRYVFIDIANDAAVRAAIHRRHGDALGHSLTVGATHWQDHHEAAAALPAPRRSCSFRPPGSSNALISERPRAAAAARRGVERVSRPGRRSIARLSIVTSTGAAAVTGAYDKILSGRARADHGHVMTLANGTARGAT